MPISSGTCRPFAAGRTGARSYIGRPDSPISSRSTPGTVRRGSGASAPIWRLALRATGRPPTRATPAPERTSAPIPTEAARFPAPGSLAALGGRALSPRDRRGDGRLRDAGDMRRRGPSSRRSGPRCPRCRLAPLVRGRSLPARRLPLRSVGIPLVRGGAKRLSAQRYLRAAPVRRGAWLSRLHPDARLCGLKMRAVVVPERSSPAARWLPMALSSPAVRSSWSS
jgi:hypothetical protein